MSLALGQNQRLSQSQTLSPAMWMGLNLLAMPIAELKDAVRHELENNPAVTEKSYSVRLQARHSSVDPTILENVADSAEETLEEHLLCWTSVLDCALHKGSFGLEIHLLTFAGEKIPRIPTCARLVMRPWAPEGDIPMILSENH